MVLGSLEKVMANTIINGSTAVTDKGIENLIAVVFVHTHKTGKPAICPCSSGGPRA